MSTIRSRIAHLLAERDRIDIGITRQREVLEAKAGRLISDWSRNHRQPQTDVESILEEGRQADLAAEAKRHERRHASAERLVADLAARQPSPDLDHRKLVILDEATGRRFRIRFPIEMLEAIGHHPAEAAHEAAGRPFAKKATTAA